MKGILSNIALLLNLDYSKIRVATAYVLLVLVSFGFIAEHIPFLEGDIIELVESAEKEKDSKDKKLIFSAINTECLQQELRESKHLIRQNIFSITGICLDVSTPPPKHV